MSVFAHDDETLHDPAVTTVATLAPYRLAVLVPAEQVPDGVPILGQVVLASDPVTDPSPDPTTAPGGIPAERPGADLRGAGNVYSLAAQPSPKREPGHIASGRVRVDLDCRTAEVDGSELELTRMEFELLALLVAHPHRVHGRRALLHSLWDTAWTGGERTVDVHVYRLRSKLGGDVARSLRTVRGIGYRWVPEQDVD